MNRFEIPGLREEEMAAYTALLRLKRATALQLAKISGMKRATLYRLIEDLIDKGLISELYEKKKRYFIAEKPEQLLKFVKDQERRVKELLPTLESLESLGAERPKVKLFEGREGIKNLYDAILEEREEIVGFTYPDMLFVVTDYHPTFLRKRIKLNIPVRLIMTDSKLSRERQKKGAKELRTVRIDKNLMLNSTFFVSGNTVAMFSMKSWFTGVLIENRELAQGMRAIFESHWTLLA